VCYLQAIDICIVFQLAAKGAADGLRNQAEDGENQKQHGHGGPVAQFAHMPTLLKTGERPICNYIEKIKTNEQARSCCSNSNHDMVQNIVAHLMAHHKKCLLGSGVFDCCVPDHNTF
jgi:hypothetical protein